MASKRSNNEGSVIQTANGRWAAVISLPIGADGTRRRRWKRARTKAEAQELLRQMRDELHRTGTIGDGTRTIAQAVESFMQDRPRSDYDEWVIRGLILDGLGRAKAAALTVTDCDDFLVACALGLGNHRPVGPDHLARVKQRLVAVLRNEIRVGNLARNVAEVAKLPAIERDRRSGASEAKQQRALSVDELDRLLAVARDSRLIIVDFCGRNGLRPAEARAVRWADVDLDRQELSVTGQMNRSNERGEVKRANHAARTIPLDEITIERLKIWHDEQERMRNRAKSAWQDLDIIASTGQGTPVDRHSLARSMRILCANANVTPAVSAYELRHTAISLQADAGASSWEIADWAGTSEAMISRVYRHRLRRVSALRPAHRRASLL